MAGSVRITKNLFRQLSSGVRDGIADLTETAAGLVEGQASANAPVRYGLLRGSISAEDARGAGVAIARRRITVGQFYGLFVHEGTERMDGRPFLTDAIDVWRGWYLAGVQLVVKRGG